LGGKPLELLEVSIAGIIHWTWSRGLWSFGLVTVGQWVQLSIFCAALQLTCLNGVITAATALQRHVRSRLTYLYATTNKQEENQVSKSSDDEHCNII